MRMIAFIPSNSSVVLRSIYPDLTGFEVYIYIYNDDDCQAFIIFNSSLVPLIEGLCSSKSMGTGVFGF